jgi:hypothetical protein
VVLMRVLEKIIMIYIAQLNCIKRSFADSKVLDYFTNRCSWQESLCLGELRSGKYVANRMDALP